MVWMGSGSDCDIGAYKLITTKLQFGGNAVKGPRILPKHPLEIRSTDRMCSVDPIMRGR